MAAGALKMLHVFRKSYLVLNLPPRLKKNTDRGVGMQQRRAACG